MLAVHIDSLLFLLLVGAAALMRFLAKRAGNPAEDETPAPRTETPPPPPRQEAQTDEEQIRKFLEALGQPPSSHPPPPVKPRAMPLAPTEIQPRPLQETARAARRRNVLNRLPPLTTTPAPEAPRRITLPRPKTAPSPGSTTFDPSPIFELQENTPTLPATPIVRPVEVYAVATQSATPVGSKSDLISLLKTPEALRQAIILREIFGPPRSLQPFDLAGNL